MQLQLVNTLSAVWYALCTVHCIAHMDLGVVSTFPGMLSTYPTSKVGLLNA